MKIILLNMGLCDSCEKPIPLPQPPNKDEIDELYNNEDALCKIIKELKNNLGKFGTGFFCEIKDKEIPFERALFTNNHVLDETDIENNKEIEIEYLNEKKYIKMTRNRRKFTNKSLDYTCIEIFKEDNITKFFEIDNSFNQKNENNLKYSFILQYTLDGKLSHSSGTIMELDDNYINYKTDSLVFSGSPLIIKQQIDNQNRVNQQIVKQQNVNQQIFNYIIGINSNAKKGKNSNYKLEYSAIPFYIILKDIKKKLYGRPVKSDISFKIEYRNIINIVYNKNNEYKSSSHLLFGKRFVENNKNNIKLIINGKESELVETSNYLIDGFNNVQMIILNILTNLESMFVNCTSLFNIDE